MISDLQPLIKGVDGTYRPAAGSNAGHAGAVLYDANGNALLGQKTKAASVPVTLASDDDLVARFMNRGEAHWILTDTGGISTNRTNDLGFRADANDAQVASPLVAADFDYTRIAAGAVLSIPMLAYDDISLTLNNLTNAGWSLTIMKQTGQTRNHPGGRIIIASGITGATPNITSVSGTGVDVALPVLRTPMYALKIIIEFSVAPTSGSWRLAVTRTWR